MSVILDALRRARGGRPAATPRTNLAVPAGLRLKRRPRRGARPGRTHWPMVAGIVVLAGVVWASIQFGLPLLRQAATGPATVAVVTPPPAPATPPDAGAASATLEAEPRPVVPDPAASREAAATIVTPPATADDAATGRTERIERPQPAAPRVRLSPRGGSTSPPPLPTAPAPPEIPQSAAVPTPTVNHFDLAVRHHNLGNFEEAVTHYTAAIQADEFNVEARNNLGLLYHERGLLNEAIQQFKRALGINPQYLRARSNLAVVLMDAGRLAEARAELRAALAVSPRNTDLLVNMALVEKADQHADQAREILIQALGHEPLNAAAHYNLALLYDEAGETGRAYSHYNDFLKNAGPEYGARLSDVQRRVDAIAPTLNR